MKKRSVNLDRCSPPASRVDCEFGTSQIDEVQLRNLSDEEFCSRQKKRLMSLHGLSSEAADMMIERQERFANILFEQWLMKINKTA